MVWFFAYRRYSVCSEMAICAYLTALLIYCGVQIEGVPEEDRIVAYLGIGGRAHGNDDGRIDCGDTTTY